MPKHVVTVKDRNRMAHLLQWGFEGYIHNTDFEASETEMPFRRILQTACVKLPPLGPGTTEVGFYLAANFGGRSEVEAIESCVVTIQGPSSEHTFELHEQTWEWYTISIPESDGDTIIYLKTPFGELVDWEREKPVIYPFPLAYLGAISFHSENALEARIGDKPTIVSWSDTDFEVERRGIDFDVINDWERIDPDNPDSWSQNADHNVYFGDIHIHTNQSICGWPRNGSQEENYRIAQYEAGLDFACLTDHEYQSKSQWERSISLANSKNKPGEFVTLIGNEWTSLDYGHRNIYFRDDSAPQINRYNSRTDSPPRLYQYLKELEKDVLVVPHHPAYAHHLMNWHYHDPELSPLVEVSSNWGSSEHYGAMRQVPDSTVPGFYVQDALARGYHLGFVGSSDGHNVMPGQSCIAGVYAPELTRGAIFDALKARRTYATSGEKIKLNFAINDFFMGSIITVNQYTMDALFPLKLMVAVEGTAPIDRIEVIGNGVVIHTYEHAYTGAKPNRAAFSAEIENPGVNQSQTSRYYYVRAIQTDDHLAWSSPIWIDFQMNERQDL